jgi:4-hydroxy-2-oxoheptanedioate aldolase
MPGSRSTIPFLIEMIGEAGWDCITINQQHGLGGNETLLSCLTAARGAELPAIVRVAENDPGLIGRALDAGAQGIMCPMIETVEDAEAFVKSVKYPPWLAQLGPLPGAARLRGRLLYHRQ